MKNITKNKVKPSDRDRRMVERIKRAKDNIENDKNAPIKRRRIETLSSDTIINNDDLAKKLFDAVEQSSISISSVSYFNPVSGNYHNIEPLPEINTSLDFSEDDFGTEFISQSGEQTPQDREGCISASPTIPPNDEGLACFVPEQIPTETLFFSDALRDSLRAEVEEKNKELDELKAKLAELQQSTAIRDSKLCVSMEKFFAKTISKMEIFRPHIMDADAKKVLNLFSEQLGVLHKAYVKHNTLNRAAQASAHQGPSPDSSASASPRLRPGS